MRRPRWCTRWASSRARRPAGGGGSPVHLRVAADLSGLPSLPRHRALHQTQEPGRQESRCLAGDDAVIVTYFTITLGKSSKNPIAGCPFFKLGQTDLYFKSRKYKEKTEFFYHYFKKATKNYPIFPYSWEKKNRKKLGKFLNF